MSLRFRAPLGVAASVTVLALGLLSEGDARAFCRTTTTPLPPSYSASRCYEEGLPLFWRNACVSYSVQSAASKRVSLADATKVIDGAFDAWNQSTCTAGKVGIAASNAGTVDCAEVRYNPNGPNQNVIVFRDASWPYNDPNNTLGLTTITFNADTGEIYDADMEINSAQNNVTTQTPVPADGFDLSSVVTHEAGHFLGLAHSVDRTATMFASYRPGTSGQRSLTTDDMGGICAIYPTAKSRVVATSVAPTGTLEASACDPTPRKGFSTTCAANPAPAPDDGGCSVPSEPAAPGSGTWLAAAIVAVTVARRRR